MLEDFLDLLRVLFYILLFIFFCISIPFVVAHVAEHWDDPIYPYSGFSPECPTWEPSDKPAIVNRQW
ncbi:MAG: hypothetical protein IJY72_02665 [Akkermansia sp.]|nr:hypothetical protein [Akkermansia sp.]